MERFFSPFTFYINEKFKASFIGLIRGCSEQLCQLGNGQFFDGGKNFMVNEKKEQTNKGKQNHEHEEYIGSTQIG